MKTLKTNGQAAWLLPPLQHHQFSFSYLTLKALSLTSVPTAQSFSLSAAFTTNLLGMLMCCSLTNSWPSLPTHQIVSSLVPYCLLQSSALVLHTQPFECLQLGTICFTSPSTPNHKQQPPTSLFSIIICTNWLKKILITKRAISTPAISSSGRVREEITKGKYNEMTHLLTIYEVICY